MGKRKSRGIQSARLPEDRRAGFASPWKRYGKAAVCILGGIALLAFLLAGTASIPFHPDEATAIYMSADWDRLQSQGPSAVAWRAEAEEDPLQIERERSGPLPRYLIGMARSIAGVPATPVDWNWSLTWDQNVVIGAVPDAAQLLTARIPQVLALFLSTLLIARIAWNFAGFPGGIGVALVFALQSKILLHARRAMSESLLLFGCLLVVAVLVEGGFFQRIWMRRLAVPILAGLAVGLAASAKQSGLLMAPVALVAIWVSLGQEAGWRKRILWGALQTALVAGSFLAVFLALNPLFWPDPVAVTTAVIRSREQLVVEQTLALLTAAPGQIMLTTPIRILALVYETFQVPLAFADIANYAANTLPAERAYIANPLTSLGNSALGLYLWGFLLIVGAVLSGFRVFRGGNQERYALLWIWLFVTAGVIVWAIPIFWQRYYLPLYPIWCLFAGLGVAWLYEQMAGLVNRVSRT